MAHFLPRNCYLNSFRITYVRRATSSTSARFALLNHFHSNVTFFTRFSSLFFSFTNFFFILAIILAIIHESNSMKVKILKIKLLM